MKAVTAVAHILKLEGLEFLSCFPGNPLIDELAILGIRPILSRTERVGVNIADGYTRVSNGRRTGVFAMQKGPGIENAYAGIAQAFADSVPILLLPAGQDRHRQDVPPTYSAVTNYRGVTKWVGQINLPNRVPEMMRRAFSQLRTGRPGPVMLELPSDVAMEEISDTAFDYRPVKPTKPAGDPQDVENAVKALLAARRPVIHAGQGVLYAEAWHELREFAELMQAPVMTTLAGKSGFPENHPLSIGAGSATTTKGVIHFLRTADLVLGIGCSFTRTEFGVEIPPGKVMIHATLDDRDLNKDYAIDYAVVGDAKLVLRQLIEELKKQAGPEGRRENGATAKEIQMVREEWLREWIPKLTSAEIPINPYRVIWDLMHTVDRAQTIVTHDSGYPRDQMVPFYEAVAPNGYIGWGKSTQLGYGLGLAMGAKLAASQKLVVNVMGDAAFGMVGMDFETAVRAQIPILTIILNNGGMGGYEHHLPIAVERYNFKALLGDYTKIADGLGGYSERVERPEEVIPAIQRAIKVTKSGRPALLEIITKDEIVVSHHV